MKDEQSRSHAEVLRHIVPEIHNALAVILGNAQLLLLSATVNPDDRLKLKAIERGSFRIQALVEELTQERRLTSSPLRSQEPGGSRHHQVRTLVP